MKIFKNKPKGEFHDLSERLLNSGESYWGNLGYWVCRCGNCDYSAACEALAHKLAQTVSLNEESRVFDAGFGCGDQLLLWLNDYNIEFLSGINYSTSQTEWAQKRLVAAQYIKVAEHMVVGSAVELARYEVFKNKQINTVLALDCAYHFPSRAAFFCASFDLLTENHSIRHINIDNNAKGKIALTDLVLVDEPQSWWKTLVLNVMFGLSRIPRENMVTLTEYKEQLATAGFENICCEDISREVFVPFADWINRGWISKELINSAEITNQQAAISPVELNSKSAKIKYKVTAAFLKWAYRHKLLRYVVVKAECLAC